MSQNTPGTWIHQNFSKDWWRVTTNGKKLIANVPSRKDAQLVSAAKELQEALYELMFDDQGLEWADSDANQDEQGIRVNLAKEKARAALIKSGKTL